MGVELESPVISRLRPLFEIPPLSAKEERAYEFLINAISNGLAKNRQIRLFIRPGAAKTQYRKIETNMPRKETARLQSQFLHSCFCERFIYSSDRSAYSAAQENRWAERGNTVYRIYRSLTDT